MRATLHYGGYSPRAHTWEYTVVTAEGNIFRTDERQYLGYTGTVIELPDDMSVFGSGWVFWTCAGCGHTYWTRTRPGGNVACPICSTMETCPEWAKMLPFEGAVVGDLDDDD
jgi:rubrerythrin